MNYNIAAVLVLLCLIAVFIPNSLQDKSYIHLLPHSHWDVGWLKTAEEYFHEEVQIIIDNVLVQLEKNPKRKFVFSEMHYISRWWNDPKTKGESRVKFTNMLKNKQIEIVGGGWTMPDEALTTYGAFITTVTRGHQWIKNTFGDEFIPKISWRIDPFGVSPAVTDIFRESGMDKTVVMRIPFDVEDSMRSQKNLEFWWTREHPLRGTTKVLTHIMDIQYCIYDMFFNWYGHTNKFNLQSRVSYFIDEIEKRSRGYKPDSVMIPYGCDFKFYDAEQRFQQVEPLIDSINENRDDISISYSLLSEYFEKVEKKSQAFTSVGGTFVPYADGRQAWWTGYYTSYSNMKRLTRIGEATLRNAEILYALAKIHGPNTDSFTKWFTELAQPALDTLRRATADVTHHDAITGTSKRYVTKSYMDITNNAINAVKPLIHKSFMILAATNQGSKLDEKIEKIMHTKDSELTFTERIDVGQLQTEDQHVPIVMFNNMAWDKLSEVNTIKLLITEAPQPQGVKLCLRDSHYNAVPFQIVKPYWDLEKLDNVNEFHLFFTTPRIPALGYVTYYLSKCAVETPVTTRVPVEAVSDATQEITYKLSNGILEVGLCNISTICSLKNLKSGKSIFAASGLMNLLEYTGANDGNQKSGAYIFRPAGNGDTPTTRPTRPPEGASLLTLVNNGTIVKEIRQRYSDYMYLILRLHENSDQLEIEYFINQGFPADKEMVLRMSTNIQNNRVLYTDNNGLDMQKREYDTGRPVAGNFAPIVYKSFIKDQNTQLSLFATQTHSIASLYDGSVELMLHRRTLYDDNRGVGESVADSSRIQGTIRLTVDAPAASCQDSKFTHAALAFNFPTTIFIDSIVKTTGDQSPKLQLSAERLQLFDPLKKQLPHNFHLLSLEYIKSLVEPDQAINNAEEFLLLRIQELTDFDCLGATSFPALLNLNDYFFKNKDLQKLSETRLDGLGEPVDSSKDTLAVDNKLKIYPLSIRTLTSAIVVPHDRTVAVQSPDFGFQIGFSVVLSFGIVISALVLVLAMGCVGLSNILFPDKNAGAAEENF